MELCLLNLLILINFFVCVILTLLCSLRACHVWLTRNHMFIREIWVKFTSFFEIWKKFRKSELGKFIPNFPLKHVITSTNLFVFKSLFTTAKENYNPLLWRNCLLNLNLKKSTFPIICFRLSLYNCKEKLWSFKVIFRSAKIFAWAEFLELKILRGKI